jgi:hypothetical protein
MTTLVEGCAGSAAVTVRRMGWRRFPGLHYRGGKARHAGQIAAAIGPCSRTLLVEPGMFGEFWGLLENAEMKRRVVNWLRAWADRPLLTLWTEFAGEAVPADPAERIARWLVLQRGSYGGRPVEAMDNRWRTHGHAGTPHRGASRNRTSERTRKRRKPVVTVDMTLVRDSETGELRTRD